jgi:hypothetical protein
MSGFDLDRAYREAAAAYAPGDYEKFFAEARIADHQDRELGVIFLKLAGCIYLATLQHQALTPTRTELMAHLRKAQTASRDLAAHLRGAFEDYDFRAKLLTQTMASEAKAREPRSVDSGAYEILAAAFPFDDPIRGFRVDGLLEALEFISDRLGEMAPEKIPKPTKGRTTALKYWLQAMGTYWVIVKGEAPTPGRYTPEVADYSSPDVAALTLAAEILDPETTSRLVVSALRDAKRDYTASLKGPGLLMGAAALASARVEGDCKTMATLFERLGASVEVLGEMMALGVPSAAPADAPRDMLLDEFFEETVKQTISQFPLFPEVVEHGPE